MFKPCAPAPCLIDPRAEGLALRLGPGAGLGERGEALLDRLDLGTRLFLSGSCRRLGIGIALGLSGKSRARFVQTAPCILGVDSQRLLALDVGGDLGESARNLLAIASELLLLLGQPFVLDAQPLQGGGPFGFVLAPLGQHRGIIRLPARGIGGGLGRLCHPAGGILRLARHLLDTGRAPPSSGRGAALPRSRRILSERRR